MEIIFKDSALEDLKYWKEKGNKKIQDKITDLLEVIKQDPFKGIGKPEPLKYEFSGLWSRRITKEHRLVYGIEKEGNICNVYSLRYHYTE